MAVIGKTTAKKNGLPKASRSTEINQLLIIASLLGRKQEQNHLQIHVRCT